MIGVILAGGESQRMGHDKAVYAVAGRPMLEWVHRALTDVCDQVVVAGRSRPVLEIEAIPDPGVAHRGPLAGLVAALHHFPGEDLAVVSVDQPWVRSETVKALGAAVGELPAVPVDNGVRQTTCAVYPPTMVDTAEAELAGSGSLQSLLDVSSFQPIVDWRDWAEDGRSWFSADDPQLVEEGLSRFGIPG